ncbi:MAG TPA: hypothetical protein IGS40_12250 [Trichormus sp. M33_DOE_039]|nr:hypothetical protein [Trichormus sp. M33_DOE_039]
MEDSASASDAVPRPRRHNCTYPVKLRIPRIGKKLQYLQHLLRSLDQESVVIPGKFGFMSDWKMHLKLTSLVPAGHQADIQPTTTKPQQSTLIACSLIHRYLGRIRSYTPQIASDPAFVQPRESLLGKQPLVKNQQVNRDATSVVITYQPAIFRSPHQQMPRVLTSSLIPSTGIAA